MILSFPVGSFHGWGICGKYISIEFQNLYKNFEHIYSIFDSRDFDDILQYQSFLDIVQSPTEKQKFKHKDILFSMPNPTFLPDKDNIILKQKNNFGYTFFENTPKKDAIKKASKFYKTIFCGSSFNEEVLNNIGITNTKTVLQGVDFSVFNKYYNEKVFNKDKFVIFSGGKLEYRKSQDITIAAFKRLQDKYDDVLLIASWYNLWEDSIKTIYRTTNIKLPVYSNQDYFTLVKQILHLNKIDLKKVLIYPLVSNNIMRSIYKNSDIGIFPNRCEGGTNLVLMEYMAMKKPVIASYNSGHKDIVDSKNALLLENQKQDRFYPLYHDSSVDEVYEKLEYAYLNYKKVQKLSKQGYKDISKLTWKNSAKRFKKYMKNG